MCVWTVCKVKNVELNLEQNVVLESFVDLCDYWSIRRWFGMQRSACKMPVRSPECGFDCKDRPDRPVGSRKVCARLFWAERTGQLGRRKVVLNAKIDWKVAGTLSWLAWTTVLSKRASHRAPSS